MLNNYSKSKMLDRQETKFPGYHKQKKNWGKK